jgi:hypothetical protein
VGEWTEVRERVWWLLQDEGLELENTYVCVRGRKRERELRCIDEAHGVCGVRGWWRVKKEACGREIQKE